MVIAGTTDGLIHNKTGNLPKSPLRVAGELRMGLMFGVRDLWSCLIGWVICSCTNMNYGYLSAPWQPIGSSLDPCEMRLASKLWSNPRTHNLPHTHISVSNSLSIYLCPLSFYPVASSPCDCSSLVLSSLDPSGLSPSLSPLSPPPASPCRVQLQWEVGRVRVRRRAVPQHRQRGALCELQRQHRRAPLWALQTGPLQGVRRGALPAMQLQRQRYAAGAIVVSRMNLKTLFYNPCK